MTAIWLAAVLGLLYALGLALDWPSWVHGANWVWVRKVPSGGWLPALLLLGGMALWLTLLLWAWRVESWPRPHTRLLLLIVVVITPLLQLVILAQHHAQPLGALFITAVGASQDGVQIADPVAFIHDHAANMPGYRDVHVRTQPPGWQVAYWAVRQGWQRWPQTADVVGGWLRRYDCLSTDLQGYTPAQVAATTLQMTILLWSGLAVLPLYGLAQTLFSAKTARVTAVVYPLMPALLVFPARYDVFYALIGITALWLAQKLVTQGQWWHYALLVGLLVGITFFAFGPLAILLLVNGFLLMHSWLQARRWQGLRPFCLFNLFFALALALTWLIFWLLWQASWLQMLQISQDVHQFLRINYPIWPLFNLYDYGVFLGLPLAVVAVIGGVQAVIRLWQGSSRRGDAFILAWLFSLLVLNLSGQVRAETGRLWLFLMMPGLLVAVATLVDTLPAKASRWGFGLLSAFAVQAVVTALFLGGRNTVPTVPPTQWTMPAQATPTAYAFGERIGLEGYTVHEEAGQVAVELYWQALTWPRGDYSVFVHVQRAGETVAQSDGAPQDGRLPTWCWVPGEVVADRHVLAVDRERPYQILVGLYDWRTGERLSVQPPVPDQAILLESADSN